MKDLQKKFLTVAPSPYSIPSAQQILTDNLQLPLQHLNPVPMPTNYHVLGGLPLQNSSGWLAGISSIFVVLAWQCKYNSVVSPLVPNTSFPVSDYLMYNSPGLSVYSSNLDKGLSPLQVHI